MSAGFRWTVSSQPRVLVLNKPMAFEPAPAHRKNRWAVDSLDYSAREVISIASGRMEVEATIKFEKNAQGLVDMLRDASDGNVVTYYPDLSNGTGYALWLVSESTELAPQAGNWSLGNYEVRTRWRDASASGTSIAALFERLLFRLEAGHFPLGYSMTRSGTVGPYIDSDGVLKSAAANIARIEWVNGTDPDGDGVKDTPGLLLEAARTNLALQSEDFTTTWIDTNATISANATTAPDGTTTADKLVEDGTLSSHYVGQTYTKAASALAYSFSIYVKATDTDRDAVYLKIQDTISSGVNNANATFNVVDGTVTQSSVGGTGFTVDGASMSYVGDGWWRCILNATSSTGTTLATYAFTVNTDLGTVNYTGDGSSGIYLWGAQLEQAASASSYIPTTTASATRNADTMDIPINFAPQALSLYVKMVDYGQARLGTAFAGDVLNIGRQNSGNGYIQIDDGGGSGDFRVVSIGSGGAQASSYIASSSLSLFDTLEFVAQIDASFGVQMSWSINGGATSTASAAANSDGMPSSWAADYIRLMRDLILSVKVAPGAKTMAEMRAL